MQNKTLNSFTLKHLIGKGGMAEVWYAENNLGKPAAVKIMLQKFIGEQQVVSRFETEAKAMLQLNHSNIRQVYDLGEYEQRPFIVMEYLDGQDLSDFIKHNKKPTESQLQLWWKQCTDALEFTHNKGIIHRDIKPSNLFLTKEGRIKILDFGIAKVKQEISLTGTGQGLGTLLYMSPEQIIDPKRVTSSTDYYSLSVSFIHLISGKSPFTETESQFKLQLQITNGELDWSTLPDNWKERLLPYLRENFNDKTIVLNKNTFDDKTQIELKSNQTSIDIKNIKKDFNINNHWYFKYQKPLLYIKLSLIIIYSCLNYFTRPSLMYGFGFFSMQDSIIIDEGLEYENFNILTLLFYCLIFLFISINLYNSFKKNNGFNFLKKITVFSIAIFWIPFVLMSIFNNGFIAYLSIYAYGLIILGIKFYLLHITYLIYFLTSEVLEINAFKLKNFTDNKTSNSYKITVIINVISLIISIILSTSFIYSNLI